MNEKVNKMNNRIPKLVLDNSALKCNLDVKTRKKLTQEFKLSENTPFSRLCMENVISSINRKQFLLKNHQQEKLTPSGTMENRIINFLNKNTSKMTTHIKMSSREKKPQNFVISRSPIQGSVEMKINPIDNATKTIILPAYNCKFPITNKNAAKIDRSSYQKFSMRKLEETKIEPSCNFENVKIKVRKSRMVTPFENINEKIEFSKRTGVLINNQPKSIKIKNLIFQEKDPSKIVLVKNFCDFIGFKEIMTNSQICQYDISHRDLDDYKSIDLFIDQYENQKDYLLFQTKTINQKKIKNFDLNLTTDICEEKEVKKEVKRKKSKTSANSVKKDSKKSKTTLTFRNKIPQKINFEQNSDKIDSIWMKAIQKCLICKNLKNERNMGYYEAMYFPAIPLEVEKKFARYELCESILNKIKKDLRLDLKYEFEFRPINNRIMIFQ